MKKLTLIVFLILATATTAQAGNATAGKLLDGLKSARTGQDYAAAVGYVRAVWELHIFTQSVGIGGTPIRTESGKDRIWPKSCIPGHVTDRVFIKGWIHWAETSSDFVPDIYGSVSMINWSALAYPCGGVY